MLHDIIGDIHGHSGKLEALLRRLGYRETMGTWRHPDRTAIFVGDFVDGGPQQLRTLRTVRRMVGEGAALAVMGNHEFNAIAWHTPDPRRPGEFLHPHEGERGARKRTVHAAFLAEVEHDPPLHAELVDWFLTLPLWLDLPGLRVVHACWHARFMAWLAPHLHEGQLLTRELMVAATDKPKTREERDDATPSVFKAVEAITKGIEAELPEGHSIVDYYRLVRTRVRVRWWDAGAATYRTSAMLPPAQRDVLPDIALPAHARLDLEPGPPLFFGHYRLMDEPALQSASLTCLDHGGATGAPLVAYRFEGEPELRHDHLVWVE